MYCAYVTTLKELRKHSNADRLQCATVFGNNVIVDMSYFAGERVIYFPVDGQLSEEFAVGNNLVRKKDENGNNIGGYLDPDKRNITALKLRGEKSEGLLMPLEVLSKYTDIDKLVDGDQITILNGHEICKKYIPIRKNRNHGQQPRQNNKRNSKEEKEKISYPFFVEHIDTAQLAFNQNAFKPGDTCYITLKMHGCFVKGTKVRMADHSLKPIEHVKMGDFVLGYDFKTKSFQPTKVINTFKNPPSNNWNEIKITRNGFSGDNGGKIVSTYNHPYWCEEENRWIQAQDLKVGMTISSLFPTYIYTSQQKEILTGLLLGDGCLLIHKNKTAEIENSCKKEHEQYIDYLVEILNGCFHKCNKVYTSGYSSKIIRAKSKRSADLYDYFDKISTLKNKGDNKLKEELINNFTPLSMAIFYMDDGSLSHNENQRDRALFAICDYSEKDAQIICRCFEKYGIYPKLYKDNNGYNRLRLNTDDAYKMFNLIYKFVPPIMRYKLPVEFRNREFNKPNDTENYIKSYILRPQKVIENNKINMSQIEYDMETELHNYIVGNSIVHNTSARTANAVQVTKKKRSPVLKKMFHLKDKEIKTFECVSGTRRTTLRNYDGGWYGSNAFREKYHNFFKERLPKGMEVFYEIVGYTEGDQTIMGRCSNKLVKDKEFSRQYGEQTVFSYGCEVGENKAYVYRMTMTNDDGYVVELPWEQVQLECEKMGVECVPLFDKFIFTTWDDLMERVEKYYDGVDPIGKTHVREGVVVRIDNRPSFTAYKHKNFNFKVLEGIIKDTADAPDMEEAEELVGDEA